MSNRHFDIHLNFLAGIRPEYKSLFGLAGELDCAGFNGDSICCNSVICRGKHIAFTCFAGIFNHKTGFPVLGTLPIDFETGFIFPDSG